MSELIRMASLNDIDTLVKVRFDYFAAEKWVVSSEQYAIIEKNLRLYFLKRLNTDFFAAFVDVDAKVASVAFLAISHLPASLSFPTGRTGTVYNVLTYPEYRKRGYATSTMNLLLEESKKQNLSYVDLSSSESGKPLYQKLGFNELKPNEHFTEMRKSMLYAVLYPLCYVYERSPSG